MAYLAGHRDMTSSPPVVGPAELLQGLGPQAQGHPEAGRRGRRQPLGCQGVAPSQVGGAPTLWAGLKGQLILDELLQVEPKPSHSERSLFI